MGKTTVVTVFTKEFKQFISLNLEKPADAQIFRGFRSMNHLIEELFFKTNQSIHEQDTLIFIGEIQQLLKAINLLRYFYEEYPQYAGRITINELKRVTELTLLFGE